MASWSMAPVHFYACMFVCVALALSPDSRSKVPQVGGEAADAWSHVLEEEPELLMSMILEPSGSLSAHRHHRKGDSSSHGHMRRELIHPFGALEQDVKVVKPHNASVGGPNVSSTGGAETAAEESGKMRQLALVWFPIGVVLALLFEHFHLRWSEVDWNLQMDRSDGSGGSEHVDNSFSGLTVGLFTRAKSLAGLYFSGAGRVKGRAYVLMLLGHNLFGNQYLSLVNFDFQRRMWNIYEYPSMSLFAALMMNWVILYTLMTLTAVYSSYTEGMLMIHWKEHTTRYFETIWLPNSYALRLRDDSRFDNPDQRIQEDVQGFCGQTYGLTLGLWNAIFGLVIYGYMLFQISPTSFFGLANIPGWLFYVALAYAAVGSIMMQYLGSNLAHYQFLSERYGGNFRAELRRVFEQSETTAAVRSQDSELGRLQSRFDHIKLITWRSMMLNKNLNWFHHFYGPFSSILFMCILMPFFIRGEVDLGRIKQCEMALGHVSGALTFFVSNYGSLSGYRATVDRLYNFRTSALEYLKEKKQGPNIGTADIEKDLLEGLAQQGLPSQWPTYLGGLAGSKPKSNSDIFGVLRDSSPAEKGPQDSGEENHNQKAVLELKDAKLSLPSGETLFDDVNLSVPAGKCLLLCGREGAGKSTVLRSLAGIWPFAESNVCKSFPSQDTILIPQKPRLPNSMSLRDAVTFPKEPDSFPDEDIMMALKKVDLDCIADGNLDIVMDVNNVLSGGEFQRLMVAHCLLSKPRCILLDESMAHLSRENQVAMYTLLHTELVGKAGTSLVSTTHDWNELVSFHDIFYMIQVNENDDSRGVGRSLVEFQPCSDKPLSPKIESITLNADSVQSLHSKLAERDEEIERLKDKLASFEEKTCVPPESEVPKGGE